MLTAQGYYVIRMGYHVKKALDTKNPMIIDYAFKGMRSEFMDIFIPAHCYLFVGNPSGLVAIPALFRRPIAFVNFSQPKGFYNWDLNIKGSISIWKRVWVAEQERFLTFREMLDLNLPIDFHRRDLEHIARLGPIKVVDNTSDEITSVVAEMMERLMGTWRPDHEVMELQKKFRSVRHDMNDDVKFTVLGQKFLKENEALLGNSSYVCS
jgi:putative glycosyltransferase (TIGR04372 family)